MNSKAHSSKIIYFAKLLLFISVALIIGFFALSFFITGKSVGDSTLNTIVGDTK